MTIVFLLSVCGTLVGTGSLQRVHPRARGPHLRLEAPIDGLKGIDMQRRLGELTFAEISSSAGDAAAGISARATVGPGAAVVGLFYGTLTRGDAAGTRVLIKAYSSAENNALAVASAESAATPSAESRMRLEASMASDGTSLAEALAENEYAAHARVQATCPDVEMAGLCRLMGRLCPDYRQSEAKYILHVFPWRGQPARLAMPTTLPPTLQSWARARERGLTEAQRTWKGVPLRACQQRGRFVRQAMLGALRGLSTLHSAGLIHQALSPSSVAIGTEDDRTGEKAPAGRLTELGFCRDARSLSLAYLSGSRGAEGEELPELAVGSDPLDSGLLERAVLNMVRPMAR
jgi:hypothetical protein